MKVIPIHNATRACDGCTACCEGWLFANIKGYSMYRGRKCQFLGENKCNDYQNRPKDPCKTFKCTWLVDLEIPHWMKPNLSNVIIVNKKTKKLGIDYLEVVEMGNKIDSEILNFIIHYSLKNKLNLYYQVNYGWNYLGSNEFIEEITANGN